MYLPTRSLPLYCLLGFTLLWTHSAAAWGNMGHRLTGIVAESLLTTTARRQVNMLLDNESLAVAATYMDTQRKTLSQRWLAADQWHYDNQPVCGDRPAYCPQQDCATAKIEELRSTLANRRADKAERAMALRLLVHLLGDIHQPLHMADNSDRGGNKLKVRLREDGALYNLHEVLDTVLIKEMIGQQRTRDYALKLKQRYQSQLKDWQRGTTADWAQQTHQLAVAHSYGDLPAFTCNVANNRVITLSDTYLQNARPISS